MTTGARPLIAVGAFVLSAMSGACHADPLGDVPRDSGRGTFVELAVGARSACALTGDGRAYCWGAGSDAQLGNGSRTSSAQPVQVNAPGVAFIHLSSGYRHSCGLALDGQAWCWGWGVPGQLGVGGPTVGGPLAVHGPAFQAITTGSYHTCAIAADGAGWCWGDNANGQLGDGSGTARFAPVPVTGGIRFRQLSAGGVHTCGIGLDGVTYCWGLNQAGQLGSGTTADADRPTRLAGDVRFSSVSAGFSHTCALTADGTAYCWGSNARGELGDGALVPAGLPGSAAPRAVQTALRFAAVEAGFSRSCGVTTDGGVLCWGAGENGELGTGRRSDETLPAQVLGTAGNAAALHANAVGTGLTYGCALTSLGSVYCWGAGDEGQLGNPGLNLSLRPLPVQ